MWPFIVVALFWIVFFGYRAVVESDSASRQETSFGTIGQCEERGRGHENYCDYTFSIGDEQYTAVRKAARGLEIGQSVTVYYDGQDPQINALEDFSEQSRRDLNVVYIAGLALVIVAAFALWDRAPHRETSDQQIP